MAANKRQFRWLAVAAVAGAFATLPFASIRTLRAQAQATETPAATNPQGSATAAVAWTAPDTSTIPPGPLGDSIRLGLHIITDTPTYARRYVGNRMNCADCHINQGTQPFGMPLAGITTVFPAYTDRDQRVITIERRIQECFERSENGTAPPSNSPEMVAIVAYMNWLSQGIPLGSTVKGRGLQALTPPPHISAADGAAIYAGQCQFCHGSNGNGIPGSFPPLWGSGSFDDGAGMHRVAEMAAFVEANMPQTNPGSLTVQQAFDVAAFVAANPRPHFTGTANAGKN